MAKLIKLSGGFYLNTDCIQRVTVRTNLESSRLNSKVVTVHWKDGTVSGTEQIVVDNSEVDAFIADLQSQMNSG